MDIVTGAVLILFLFFIAPIFVFVVVKMGTYGYLMAKHRFHILHQLEREEDESSGEGKT